MAKFKAIIFINNEEVAAQEGDDIDALYNWMLIKAQDRFGDLSGEIQDSSSGKVLKSFRKAPPD